MSADGAAPEHGDPGAVATTALLFTGGPIYPMASQALERGGALLTRGDRVAYVGPAEGLDSDLARGAAPVDLGGRALLPGLCDGHMHLTLAAAEHGALSLFEVRSKAELAREVRRAAAAAPAGSWIRGQGWEQRLLGQDAASLRAALDAAAPDHPVFLASKDMHSVLLNSPGLAALLSGVRLPDKCVVERGQGGEPTGLVLEEIFALRELLLPPASEAELLANLPDYLAYLHACGVTTVHSQEEPAGARLLRRYLGTAPVRRRARVLYNLLLQAPEEVPHRARRRRKDALPGWLAPGGYKLFLDGTFGTLSAAVSAPYASGGGRGLLLMSDEELGRWLTAIRESGGYAVMHAIGDRAVDQALQGVAALDWPAGTVHRVEHAQLVSGALLARTGALRGVAISGQPSHMWGDREIVARHLTGEPARRYAYAFASVLEAGADLIFGSDAPVEQPDPWRGVQAALTRMDGHQGQGPWIPRERLDLEQCLRAHTTGPARLHGAQLGCGALRAGGLADLVVLEPDPFEVARQNPRALGAQVRAAETYLAGERVHPR